MQLPADYCHKPHIVQRFAVLTGPLSVPTEVKHPRTMLAYIYIYIYIYKTLYIGVLGYIGIVQHKEHSPEVLSIPPGTPCIYIYIRGLEL